MKQVWKPGTMIYPLPAVLVGCGSCPDDYNLITVAWTGTICTNPAMCYISVRPERHSYELIKRTMEFTLNLTTESMAKAVDWCGVRSGKDYHKFVETCLTPVKGNMVSAPCVEESPLSIECRVKEIVKLDQLDADKQFHIERNSSLMEAYGLRGGCVSLLIDPQGEIVAQNPTLDEVKKLANV